MSTRAWVNRTRLASLARYPAPLACADMASAYVRVMSRLDKHAGLRVFRIFRRRLRAWAGATARHIDCRLLPEHEVLAYCADPALELVPSKVKAAYRRGDLCVGAFEQ